MKTNFKADFKVDFKAYAVLACVVLATTLLFLFNRASGTDSSLTGLPLDDAWIHLVYARNLAEGFGFAYNPGTLESGFTSPLWVLLLAPGFWVPGVEGVAAAWIPKILGIALSCISAALAFRLAYTLTGRRAAAWAAGLMLAVDPALGFARLSGMEVMAAVAAVLWTLLALAEKSPGRVGVGVALCALARPELAVFGILALVALWPQLRVVGLRENRLRTGVAALAPTLVAGGAWVLYNLAVIGHPLPATFYAKAASAGTGLERFRDLSSLVYLLGDLPWFALGAGLPLFALGVWKLAQGKTPAGLLVVVSALVVPLAIAGAHDFAQPASFFWSRYFMPAIPLLYLPVAVAIGEAFAWIRTHASKKETALAILAGLLLVPGLIALPAKTVQQADLYSWNNQNINEMQVALALWIHDNIPAQEMIAVNDAGALRFLGGHTILDLQGLNNHEVLIGGALPQIAIHRPRYFALFPSWAPQVLEDPSFVPRVVVRTPNYTICDCAQDEIVFFEKKY